MDNVAITFLVIGSLFAIVILVSLGLKIASMIEKKKERDKLKHRDALTKKVKEIRYKVSDNGIDKDNTPVSEDLMYNLRECESLMRDGRRPLDKLIKITATLEKRMEVYPDPLPSD